MHEIDVAIGVRASTQHGLITRQQATDLGATASMIAHRLRSRRWRKVDRATYHVSGAPFTWHTRVLACCLASKGVASHRTAAVLWQVPGFRQGPPELTIAHGRSYRRDGVRTHESTDLDLATIRSIDGIPTTGAARLLVDLGAVCEPRQVEDATFDVINRKLLGWPAVYESLVLHGRRGRRGVAALRHVLERNFGEVVPESQLEIIFEHLLEDARLPPPDRQIQVHDDHGFVGRVDFGYPKARLLIEVDGRSIHERRQALEADNRRHNRLTIAGYTVLVFTSRMILREPAVIERQIRTILAERGMIHELLDPAPWNPRRAA
jgi:very-short-patch-repair endonuclease